MCYSALVKQDLKLLEKKFGSHIVREQFELYDRLSESNTKKLPKVAARIFPGSYTAASIFRDQLLQTLPMRYGTFHPIEGNTSKKYTSYNARLDNLESSFWSNAFLKHHGFLQIEKFYEWVAVADLIRAKTVNFTDVKDYFSNQINLRKALCMSEDRTFKLTPTEKRDPLDRKIIIEFYSEHLEELLVPIIANFDPEPENFKSGFAILTTEPSSSISLAGHDRSPIFFGTEDLPNWLDTSAANPIVAHKLLAKFAKATATLEFKHRIAG